ncbi:MAG: LPS export ABC transporter permease LptG [Xanthomonadales bacterium]|nr:LPS export ABC transporter permease LptG [Xanthomonadales bacterium]
MKIIDRYVAVTVIRGILSIWVLLLGFILVVSLISELQGDKGSYAIGQAAWFVLLQAPSLAYKVFPFATLIGTLVSVGNLGNSQELVALRSSGVSRQRLTVSVLMGASALLIPIMMVGEYLAPDLQQSARTFRLAHKTGRIHLGGAGGLWIRDGGQIINIRAPVITPGETTRFSNLQIYNLDDNFKLQSITNAKEALPTTNASDGSPEWTLLDVSETVIGESRIREQREPQRAWGTRVEVGLLSSAVNRPNYMSMRSLHDYAEYLQENGQDAREYVAAYWEKIYFPFTIYALLLLGLPFVFVMNRQQSIGVNIFAGIVAGSVYLIMARWVQNFAEAFGFPIWLVAALPIVALSSFGFYRLRKAV